MRLMLTLESRCFLLFPKGDKMNKLGRLNVDEFLQVKDVPDVYAIGDCNDVSEIKLAYGAETQGKYVADNLKHKHEGKDMKPYNVNSKFTFVCKDVHAFMHARHSQQLVLPLCQSNYD